MGEAWGWGMPSSCWEPPPSLPRGSLAGDEGPWMVAGGEKELPCPDVPSSLSAPQPGLGSTLLGAPFPFF